MGYESLRAGRKEEKRKEKRMEERTARGIEHPMLRQSADERAARTPAAALPTRRRAATEVFERAAL